MAVAAARDRSSLARLRLGAAGGADKTRPMPIGSQQMHSSASSGLQRFPARPLRPGVDRR
eukprot:2162849-Alexandrium_andersonii.AAC.1